MRSHYVTFTLQAYLISEVPFYVTYTLQSYLIDEVPSMQLLHYRPTW